MTSYLNKNPVIALLLLSGLSHEELLSFSKVTEDTIKDAKQLLMEKGYIFGSCVTCNRIGWLDTSGVCIKCIGKAEKNA